MRLVEPDVFADKVHVGVFGKNSLFACEVADARRDGDDFHVGKLVEPVAQGVYIHVVREFDAFFLHGFEQVVQSGINGLAHVPRFGEYGSLAEISFEREESVPYEVVEGRGALGVGGR